MWPVVNYAGNDVTPGCPFIGPPVQTNPWFPCDRVMVSIYGTRRLSLKPSADWLIKNPSSAGKKTKTFILKQCFGRLNMFKKQCFGRLNMFNILNYCPRIKNICQPSAGDPNKIPKHFARVANHRRCRCHVNKDWPDDCPPSANDADKNMSGWKQCFRFRRTKIKLSTPDLKVIK
jgi:hypothetical protein